MSVQIIKAGAMGAGIIFLSNGVLAETSIREISTRLEDMFSTTWTVESGGKIFEFVTKADATSEDCIITFKDTTDMDGAPHVNQENVIDIREVQIDKLNDVPSYLRDTPEAKLAKISFFKPLSGSFDNVLERFGKAREGVLAGALGTCTPTSCIARSGIYFFTAEAREPSGHEILKELYKACTK